MTGNHLMPAANTHPVAASAAPAMKSAASNRVSFQSLRMLHPNRWPTLQAESLRLPFWRRPLGDKWAAQSLLRGCPAVYLGSRLHLTAARLVNPGAVIACWPAPQYGAGCVDYRVANSTARA